jgi:hypothetical protein
MTAEDLARMAPIMPTESVPERFQYVREEAEFVPEFVHQVDRLKTGDFPPTRPSSEAAQGHRPPWVGLQPLPQLVPYKVPNPSSPTAPPVQLLSHGPTHEASVIFYPWTTFGQISVGTDPAGQMPSLSGGAGVLIGPKLMMTASHLVPWNLPDGSYWMKFTAGRREADPAVSAFVTRLRGIPHTTDSDPSGYDYVICRINPALGEQRGWLGSSSLGSDDAYYDGRWHSVGYPTWFFEGRRPAYEFNIRIVDLDSDDPGLELETDYHVASGGGWSGGPLWGVFPGEDNYKVIGIKSGWEVDVYDPARGVFAGGPLLVDLVKHGLANF